MLAESEIREFLWNVLYDFIDEEPQEMIHQFVLKMASIGTQNWITFRGHLMTSDNVGPLFKPLFLLARLYVHSSDKHAIEELIAKELSSTQNFQVAIEHVRKFKQQVEEKKEKVQEKEKVNECLIQLNFYNYFKKVLARDVPQQDITEREPYIYIGVIAVSVFEFMMDQFLITTSNNIYLLTLDSTYVCLDKSNCPDIYQPLLELLQNVKAQMKPFYQDLLGRRRLESDLLLNRPEREMKEEHNQKFVQIRSDINNIAINVSQMKGFHMRSERCFIARENQKQSEPSQ
jgi:hypothetical protein